MPEQERQTYTVTPGPAVLARMGQSWTLHLTDGAPVMFSHGEDGEKPGPVTLSLTPQRAEELRRDGYEVEGEKLPEPAVDPIPPSEEADFLEEAGDPVPDAGPGIDPIGPPQDNLGEAAVPAGVTTKQSGRYDAIPRRRKAEDDDGA